MVTLIFLGVLAALLLALVALSAFLADTRTQAMAGRGVMGTTHTGGPTAIEQLETRLRRTMIGRRVADELQMAGLAYPLWTVALGALLLSTVVPLLLWQFVAPLFGVVGVLGGWLVVRWWLRRQRDRYRDRFVDQIPDLARVLSNATNAGLSIRTAWAVAEQEMEDPARREIARINAAVRFGASLEEAMTAVEDRLPSREVRVLMSTLVISSRSGGSLVSALRDISYMLDERKETKREVKSVMSQAVATGYALMGFGVVILTIANVVKPGTIERMTTNIFGLGGLILAGGMLLLGHVLIRRITRIDL